jgi:hypothetical protein
MTSSNPKTLLLRDQALRLGGQGIRPLVAVLLVAAGLLAFCMPGELRDGGPVLKSCMHRFDLVILIALAWFVRHRWHSARLADA